MCFFASCFLYQVGVLHQPYDLKCAGVDLGEDRDGITAVAEANQGRADRLVDHRRRGGSRLVDHCRSRTHVVIAAACGPTCRLCSGCCFGIGPLVSSGIGLPKPGRTATVAD
jgi:hypothetical protein